MFFSPGRSSPAPAESDVEARKAFRGATKQNESLRCSMIVKWHPNIYYLIFSLILNNINMFQCLLLDLLEFWLRTPLLVLPCSTSQFRKSWDVNQIVGGHQGRCPNSSQDRLDHWDADDIWWELRSSWRSFTTWWLWDYWRETDLNLREMFLRWWRLLTHTPGFWDVRSHSFLASTSIFRGKL